MARRIEFRAKLWLHPGQGGWHFVSLPKAASAEIRASAPRTGWGSVRVIAIIGETSWRTSIFPDSKTGTYLLPVKAEVRRRERLAAGGVVRCRLEFV